MRSPSDYGGAVNFEETFAMTFVMMLLPLLCAACSGATSTQAGLTSGTGTRHNPPVAVSQTREYVTDAQRARAQYYWLPQNRLPPDAGVEHPTSGGAAATGD
jgi:hypothetical protein